MKTKKKTKPKKKSVEKQPIIYWFIHHMQLIEFLNQSVKNRLHCIKYVKDSNERPARIKAFKPVKFPHLLPIKVRKLLAKARPIIEKCLKEGKGTRFHAPIAGKLRSLVNNSTIREALRRRLYAEYPDCPCHHYGSYSELVYGRKDARKSVEINAQLYGKKTREKA